MNGYMFGVIIVYEDWGEGFFNFVWGLYGGLEGYFLIILGCVDGCLVFIFELFNWFGIDVGIEISFV